MRKRDVLAVAGVVAVAAGVVALGFLLKKFLSNTKVEKFEENLVARIVENSPIKGIVMRKSRKRQAEKAPVKRKSATLVAVRSGNATKLLAVMKKGHEYSQVELGKVSKIPYRSVRRYIDLLIKSKKVQAQGYGKGKRFVRA